MGRKEAVTSGVIHRWMMHIDVSHIKEENVLEMHFLVKSRKYDVQFLSAYYCSWDM